MLSKASRIALNRWYVLDVFQSYPSGAGLVMSGQVPLGWSPSLSGTQYAYVSVQLLETSQLSYLRSAGFSIVETG